MSSWAWASPRGKSDYSVVSRLCRLKSSSCKKCREASMCQHKKKRKRCVECKPLRDLGSVGMAAEVHQLLSLLEREHFPYATHPRRIEVSEKMARLRAFACAHVTAPYAPEAVARDDGAAA